MYRYMICLNFMFDTVDFDALGGNRGVAEYLKRPWNAIKICRDETSGH